MRKSLLLSFIFTITGLIVCSLSVQARDIRIFPVAADPSGTCVGAVLSACDLVRATAGFAPLTGPDAGIAPQPGDTLVVEAGLYLLQAFVAGAPANGTGPVVVPGTNAAPFVSVMVNLTVRSRDGRDVTVIDGNNLGFPAVIIGANNVRFGGNLANQGFTVQNTNDEGIQLGTPVGANPYVIDLSPGDQGREDIVIQHNFIFNIDDDMIDYDFVVPKSIENIRIEYNILRLSRNDDGINISGSIIDVGGSGEDEGFFILYNTIDSMDDDGIDFGNIGNQEQVLIEYNYIVRNGDEGIDWDPSVLKLKNISVSHNLIMFNEGSGIEFQNSGEIEYLRMVGNRNPQGTEGITGNEDSGVLFLNLTPLIGPPPPGFAPVGVVDIQHFLFEDNVVNANGDEDAVAISTGPGGNTPFFTNLFDGVTVLNGGNFSDAVIRNNLFLNNAGSGFTIGLPGNITCGFLCYLGGPITGDFKDTVFEGNYFLNNGTFGDPSAPPLYPHGDGLAAFVLQDISNIQFINNESSENFNNGIFLASTGDDIVDTYFVDNVLNKNGLGIGIILFVPGFPGNGLAMSSFGDIRGVRWTGGQASRNGGSGIFLDGFNSALASIVYGPMLPAINNADIEDVTISNAHFHLNGANAPQGGGGGDGLRFFSDKINHVEISEVSANQNDDFGVELSALDDLTNVSIVDSSFSHNDNNNDGVGSGIQLDSNDDVTNALIQNVIASGNHIGVDFQVRGNNGRSLSVLNSTIEYNKTVGVLVEGKDDLSDIIVADNLLYGNLTGISLEAKDRGQRLRVEGNRVRGLNDSGIGLLLAATNAQIFGNSFSHHRIGVEVQRALGSAISGNNIFGNRDYGIDALGLLPGNTVDATNNWWGEPSGPRSANNVNGLGNTLTDKVAFEPWLSAPAVPTDSDFQITNFEVSPEPAAAGQAVTVSATIRNSGSEAGTQSVSLSVSGSAFTERQALSQTINPGTEVELTFEFVPAYSGAYEIVLDTGNDSASATFQVTGGATNSAIALCDTNQNNVIDDDEISACIQHWATGHALPQSGATISDADITVVVGLWVTGQAHTQADSR